MYKNVQINDKQLGIFNGDCLRGICGEETDITDFRGNKLKIGDIVFVVYNEYQGGNHSGYLSAIVNNKYVTYQNMEIEERKDFENFVMGIAAVTKEQLAIENEAGELLDGWVIQKIKDFSEIIDGEHWKEFGFNYKLFNLNLKKG